MTFTILRRKAPVLTLVVSCLLASQGGRACRGEVPQSGPEIQEKAITDSHRDHWAFQPLSKASIPTPADAGWCRNPIDAFVLSRLQQKGLRPVPEADRQTLIRRLSFDLTGLPPTPQELATFLADVQPDSYERLVDRLLGSPGYGEKWGQLWLELARFAETDGFEHDKVRPNAWRYRDWVIGAFNADMSYDQFVTWQLAGDEVAPGNEEALAATGFCLAGPDMPDINSQDERRHTLLNELTGTTGAVFLGLQIGCAQCHDHKYDPISQADFYRLRAFFEPALALQKDKPPSFPMANGTKASSRIYVRGDFRQPGPEVHPAYPRIANPSDETLPESVRATAAGQRTALAQWLLRPDHPLTTRVMANRLWQFHLGKGLSQTPSDFGLLGDEPMGLELLDWLAGELVRRGWSLKEMHRLIVTSATYRQVAEPSRSESGGRSFARYERRRLTGEELRDAMWSASESLESTRGGQGVMPPLPEELTKTLLKNQWSVSLRRADHYRRSIYVFARRNLRYPIFDAFDRPDAISSCPERNRSTTAPQALHLLNSELSLDAARRLAGISVSASQDPSHQIRDAVLRAFSRDVTPEELSRFQQFLDQQRDLLRREARPADSLAMPSPYPDDSDPYFGAAFVDLCLALFNSNEFVFLD